MKIDIEIKENDEKILPIIWINDRESEIYLRAELSDNSQLTIVGLFYGSLSSSVIFNTDVVHSGLHTKSLTVIRAVFQDQSSFNNEGVIRIQNGAKYTNGFFDSKVLLFDDAKGRSIPSLEIDENEVKAGHASTIGRPDLEQLLYLRSRGLTEKEAERLLISGFFDPVLKFLPEGKKIDTKTQLQQILT